MQIFLESLKTTKHKALASTPFQNYELVFLLGAQVTKINLIFDLFTRPFIY